MKTTATTSKATRSEGSALIAAMFVLVLLGAMGMVLLFLSQIEMVSNRSAHRAKQMFFLAEAGIEHGRTQLNIDIGLDEFDPALEDAFGADDTLALANTPFCNLLLGVEKEVPIGETYDVLISRVAADRIATAITVPMRRPTSAPDTARNSRPSRSRTSIRAFWAVTAMSTAPGTSSGSTSATAGMAMRALQATYKEAAGADEVQRHWQSLRDYYRNRCGHKPGKCKNPKTCKFKISRIFEIEIPIPIGNQGSHRLRDKDRSGQNNWFNPCCLVHMTTKKVWLFEQRVKLLIDWPGMHRNTNIQVSTCRQFGPVSISEKVPHIHGQSQCII